tara:strand:- start:1248 stop:2390 length:1143 start_codon:yes stop_codon:yes gene_type:complete
MKFSTKAIHAGCEADSATGAIMTPIYQTSTYIQESPGVHKGFEYSRTQNPTRMALEQNLAAIENGTHGFCFGSGMAAIDCVIKLLSPGDEVISTNDLYGGSYRIFTKIFAQYGIKFHFVGMESLEAVSAKINANTKLIWVETPTNPTLKIIDIKAMSALAKANSLMLAVDNTFATSYLQNPLDLGADIVMHSATKYLGGHSDVVLGALVVKDADLAERIAFIQNSSGGVCGPFDSWLVLRGIKTLAVRMKAHSENGSRIARFLKEHPLVNNVYWPGLSDHPNHDIACSQMNDFGGMLSFDLKEDSQDKAFSILSAFKLFSLAESLGGVESLCGHPASMTHAAIPREERIQSGVTDSLIRLSVGIEDIEDLLADLEQALNA